MNDDTGLLSGACACPACGSERLRKIGDDEREVLEDVPSHFKVVVHVRPKLSCRDCETITQPPMPSLPIERGRPGPGLVAHVLVSNYCDHLPLNRQSEIYGREGVSLDPSTLADWVGRAAWLLEPVATRVVDYAIAGPTIHADDPPIPVQDPGRGRNKSGRLWVVVRDEGTWDRHRDRRRAGPDADPRRGQRDARFVRRPTVPGSIGPGDHLGHAELKGGVGKST